MPRILGRTRRPVEQRAPSESGPVAFWSIFVGVGLALAAVGWTDVALLWYPPNLGRPDWEFGAISAHFDAMALATVGMAMIVAGALARGRQRWIRVLAVACAVLGVLMVVLLVVFVFDVPIMLRAGGERMRGALVEVSVKTTSFGLVYSLLYLWLGWHLRRATHARKSPAREESAPAD